jgi:4-methyl-5(b-hydroxyethyl)-thiazole monophosphate biosynthesis
LKKAAGELIPAGRFQGGNGKMSGVLILLAEGCEELEAVTVIDLLRRAGIEVLAAGLEKGSITASRGVKLIPDIQLTEVLDRDFDMIVLPGGARGAERLAADPAVQDMLQRMARQNKYTAAICAAPKVLAQAGLLKGRRATSYPGILDDAEDVVYATDPVIIDGRIVTSRGPGTAMDFALTLIELLAGKTRRDEVEAGLQRC